MDTSIFYEPGKEKLLECSNIRSAKSWNIFTVFFKNYIWCLAENSEI